MESEMRSMSVTFVLGCICGHFLMGTVGMDLMLWSPNPNPNPKRRLYFTGFPLTCALGFFHACQIGISCPVVMGSFKLLGVVGRSHLHLHLHNCICTSALLIDQCHYSPLCSFACFLFCFLLQLLHILIKHTHHHSLFYN